MQDLVEIAPGIRIPTSCMEAARFVMCRCGRSVVKKGKTQCFLCDGDDVLATNILNDIYYEMGPEDLDDAEEEDFE